MPLNLTIAHKLRRLSEEVRAGRFDTPDGVDLAAVRAAADGCLEPVVFPYGFCPHCARPGVERERRPNGNDKCDAGHCYPTAAAVPTRGRLTGPRGGSGTAPPQNVRVA